MKYLSVILLLLSVAVCAGAQANITAPKWAGRYLVVYLEDVYKSFDESPAIFVEGGLATQNTFGKVSVDHEVKCKLFETLVDVFLWLNKANITVYPTGEEHHKSVIVDKEHLIAIYDLSTAKRVELELKTEEVVKPKRVEIQEERWTNQEWRVK